MIPPPQVHIKNFLILSAALLGASQPNCGATFSNQSNSNTNQQQQLDTGVDWDEAATRFKGNNVAAANNLLKLGKNFLTPEQIEMVEIYFYQNDSYDSLQDVTVSEYAHRVANAKLQAQSTSDVLVHRYDSLKDLKAAAGPKVNQELCLKQLEHLNERARQLAQVGATKSKDLNLVHLLDTFGGSIPKEAFLSHGFRVGNYEVCQRMQIAVQDGKYSPARYCIGSMRYKDWPSKGPIDELIALKTGFCLPESCDSLKYKNKYELIAQLNSLNAPPSVAADEMHLASLYCPPDQQSELRVWWRSWPTLLTVGFICLWLTVLLGATIIDELNKRRKQQSGTELSTLASKIGMTNGLAAVPMEYTDTLERICRSLSITSNLRSLFSTEKSSSDKSSSAKQQEVSFVNLDVLEGIKVLTAMYIISGHVLMLSMILLGNSRDLGRSKSLVWTLSNLMPAFAVNAFFAITGILTTYLMFKQNISHSFITSPFKWMVFILYRYLRTMPMYALVVLYTKHVARFTGDGPMWDYGTSSLAARRNCEQEPWAWTFLFGANFKSPLKHCIPSAWYLANDFQFFIVTPIFLAALFLRPRLGRAMLVTSILAGYLAGIWSIWQSELRKMSPIASFKPHGFTLYVNYLHESYTHPQYRIPSYLIGLLLGHMLFEYEQRRRAHLEQQSESTATATTAEAMTTTATTEEQNNKPTTAPVADVGWSQPMTKYGAKYSLVVFALIMLTPSIASRIDMDSSEFYIQRAKTLYPVVMSTLHLFYASSVGVYVLLATTGHGSQLLNHFLSQRFWKPFSRLSLCVMLVNVEVIAYLTQTSRKMQFIDNQYLTSLNLMAFICTYLVSTVVCVLFEAPVRAALNYLLAYLMNQLALKKRTKSKSE